MEKTTRRVLNETLVKLFNNIMSIEEKAVITEEYKDITNNDMHIIEAIGIEEPRRMSDIAKRLDVTMGTLTTNMNSLEDKGYIVRERSTADKRVVLVVLTPKGKTRSREENAGACLKNAPGCQNCPGAYCSKNSFRFRRHFIITFISFSSRPLTIALIMSR